MNEDSVIGDAPSCDCASCRIEDVEAERDELRAERDELLEKLNLRQITNEDHACRRVASQLIKVEAERDELREKLSVLKLSHQAELRRVAEAVRDACRYPTRLHPVCGHVTMSYLESLDLDAIVRGTR